MFKAIRMIQATCGRFTCCTYCVTPRVAGEHNCLLTDCADGFSVRHEAEGVLENATRVEERQGDAHDALQPFLCPSEPGSSCVFHLVKHLILPKGEDWHQMSAEKGGKKYFNGKWLLIDFLLTDLLYTSLCFILS